MIHQEDLAILNGYAIQQRYKICDTKADLKGETEKCKNTGGDINSPLSVIDRTTKSTRMKNSTSSTNLISLSSGKYSYLC